MEVFLLSVKKVGKVWSFRIDVGLDSRSSKRKQIYRSGFKTKCEALEEMAKLQLKINTEEYTEPEKMHFNEYIVSWLYKTYKHEVQLPTYEKAEPIIRYHFVPYFKSTLLSKITIYVINQFYAAKLQQGLANATVREMHNLFSKALQKVVKWGLLLMQHRQRFINSVSKLGRLRKLKHFLRSVSMRVN